MDLREHYGVDLDDLYTGDLRLHKLLWLVRELPRSSRLFVELGGEAGPFDVKDFLLLDLIDLMNTNTYWASVVAAGTVGKEYSKLAKKAPTRIRRPGEEKPKPKWASKEDLKRIFGQQ